jgi:hypothetical protein
MMQAVQVVAPGTAKFVEAPMPELRPVYALVRMLPGSNGR